MRNYRTTIIGALLAGLSFLAIYQSNGGNLSDWKQWLIPTLIAILGYLSKDAGVSGTVKIMIAYLCMLTIASCSTNADGKKTFLGLTSPQWSGVGEDTAKAAAEGGIIGYAQRRSVKTTSGK